MLLNLRNTDGKRYELIVRQICRVLPTFKDFVLEEEAGKVLLRWVGRQSDKVFGSHLTSDGSLLFIATQSPYLVDCFELENIIVASASDGETILRNLPRAHYQRWLDEEYQLSDIWLQQATGEVAWLGDNQPVNRDSAIGGEQPK